MKPVITLFAACLFSLCISRQANAQQPVSPTPAVQDTAKSKNDPGKMTINEKGHPADKHKSATTTTTTTEPKDNNDPGKMSINEKGHPAETHRSAVDSTAGDNKRKGRKKKGDDKND